MGGNCQGEKWSLKERETRRGKVIIIILTACFLQTSCQVTQRSSPKDLAISLALPNVFVNRANIIENESSSLGSPSHTCQYGPKTCKHRSLAEAICLTYLSQLEHKLPILISGKEDRPNPLKGAF